MADGRRAGLDDESIAALRRGDFSRKSPAEKAALEFAHKMTVNSASVTDDEFAALVKHYGEKTVAAMVLTMAYANFQDRLLLCLGSSMEPGGPLPPLDVVFAPGASSRDRLPRRRGHLQRVRRRRRPLPSGKDLIEDEPRVDLPELRRVAGETREPRGTRSREFACRAGRKSSADCRRASRLATASSGTSSAWAISPSWPPPGRPTCGRPRPRPATRWTGSSDRACSGSRPAP